MFKQTINPENPNNPFDYIGKYHNLILDSFCEEISNSSKIFNTPTDFVSWMIRTIADKSFDFLAPQLKKDLSSISKTVSMMTTSTNYFEDLSSMLSASFLSADEKKYFIELNEEVINSDISNPEGLKKLVNQLTERENRVKDIFSESKIIEEMAYSTISVAKYSAVYWNSNWSNPQSNWSNLKINFKKYEPWDIEVPEGKHWSEYAADDAASAIGAVLCSAGTCGPWGVVASAAFGTGWSVLTS